MRKKLLGLVLVLVLIFLFGKWLASDSWAISPLMSQDPIGVYNSPSNNRQYGTTVWLGAYNGKVLMYRDSFIALKKNSKYDGKLLMLDGNKIKVLHALCSRNDGATIIGQAGQYVYYWTWSTSFWDHSYNIELCCYDVQHDTVTKLYNGQESKLRSMNYFAEDGSVYIVLSEDDTHKPSEFLHVKGNTVLETVSSVPSYQVGSQIFWPDYPPQGHVLITNTRIPETIYHLDDTGEREKLSLDYGDGRSVISTAQGLVIHNENSGGCLLYHIDEHGALHELFNADCMSSRSAVAVHESTVFLSVLRYEKLDDTWKYFPESFKNDMISGTYRINLEDYSVQKISNAAYRGLFLFDHHSFFGCDEDGNIEQVDFDGNVLSKPVEVKPHWPF